MQRPIGIFTDFGPCGPYVGQVKCALLRDAPDVPVVELMSDAPAVNPQAAAYLLAALLPYWPANMVVAAVVDPGVGGRRRPVIIEADGRLLVGPDNGLFELVARRAATSRCWEITWEPEHLSASFHGRDLFAPVAARLARGISPDALGRQVERGVQADWPDDLPAVIYGDWYGNAMTGLRAEAVAVDAVLVAAGRRLERARTFSDRAKGEAFWYENSIGLVEIAINQGCAMDIPGIEIGAPVLVTK